MRIINKSKNIVLASQARMASNFFKRLTGLMFRRALSKEEALMFIRAPSMHTFFMRFSLDILFLNREGRVIKIVRKIKPFRIVWCWGSFFTVEFSSQNNNLATTSLGDFIIVENVV